MAWRYIEGVWQDQDVATPHELNDELRALVGEMNGQIDRDNMAATFQSRGPFIEHTFNKLTTAGLTTADSISKTEGDGIDWQIIDELVASVDTPDCMLELEAHWTWEESASTGFPSSLRTLGGILVDGQSVAESGWERHKSDGNNCYLHALVPVGPGTHRIECAMQIARWTTSKTVGPTLTVDIDYGLLSVLEHRR